MDGSIFDFVVEFLQVLWYDTKVKIFFDPTSWYDTKYISVDSDRHSRLAEK